MRVTACVWLSVHGCACVHECEWAQRTCCWGSAWGAGAGHSGCGWRHPEGEQRPPSALHRRCVWVWPANGWTGATHGWGRATKSASKCLGMSPTSYAVNTDAVCGCVCVERACMCARGSVHERVHGCACAWECACIYVHACACASMHVYAREWAWQSCARTVVGAALSFLPDICSARDAARSSSRRAQQA